MSIDLKDIQFNPMIPVMHMKSAGGFLPDGMVSAALWYFIGCATQAYFTVEGQKTLEGDQDQQVDIMQIADSTMKIYNTSKEEVFNHELIELAKREAARCQLPWDSRLDAFFSSGGTVNRYLDRDPDKL